MKKKTNTKRCAIKVRPKPPEHLIGLHIIYRDALRQPRHGKVVGVFIVEDERTGEISDILEVENDWGSEYILQAQVDDFIPEGHETPMAYVTT